MKVTSLLKGAALIGVGYIIGASSGRLNCLDNILEHNPEMKEISYHYRNGAMITHYQKLKDNQK